MTQLLACPSAVLAVDQGTSSTKAVLVDRSGRVLGRASVAVSRSDPQPGWVEQSASEIRDSVIQAMTTIMQDADVDVVGVGLSNQRESAVIWSRETGEPLGPMLGWQDRRTAGRAVQLQRRGVEQEVRRRTGLPLDPTFSALKIEWLLDQVDPSRELSRAGRIAVGTVDSWILHCLTGEHRIETGNASRTQLLDIQTAQWDPFLLDLFNVPMECLPSVESSDEPSKPILAVPGLEGVCVTAVLGDSHAALYAHGARVPGQVKATYGSGGSVMGLSSGFRAQVKDSGLVRTIAWSTPKPVYAFEGTALSVGSTLVWLSKLLGVDMAQLAELGATGREGLDFVPAFAGLGAPYWDESAVALFSGLGLGSTAADLARAAFESIALQTESLLHAAEEDESIHIDTMLVDGGPTQNDWLMQLQADLSQRLVMRSNVAELSAMGVAHLAGVATGLWSSEECLDLPRDRSPFRPQLRKELADSRWNRWEASVERARFRPSRSDNNS